MQPEEEEVRLPLKERFKNGVFLIEDSDYFTLRKITSYVMRFLKKFPNCVVVIEGRGKENIRGVDKVTQALGKWIEVLKVNTGIFEEEKTITVTARKADGFDQAFRQCMQKVQLAKK